MAESTQQDRVLSAVSRSGGDLSHPTDLRPNLPQETAEADSVKPANDAIRDLLREQSGRTGEGDRSGQAVEEPAPRKRTSKTDDK